jgi:hypothetical protein
LLPRCHSTDPPVSRSVTSFPAGPGPKRVSRAPVGVLSEADIAFEARDEQTGDLVQEISQPEVDVPRMT